VCEFNIVNTLLHFSVDFIILGIKTR